MEFVKSLKQTNIIKYIFIALLGSILLAISSKVKNISLNENLLMKDIDFKINSKNSIVITYEKNSLDFGEIVNYLNQNNIKIEDISTEDGDLEDVFVQLTKH